MDDKRINLQDVVSIVYITPENAVFGERNHFLILTLTTKDENGNSIKKEYDRVFLHRCFPFEHLEKFISVQDTDKNELGIITDLQDFPAEAQELLRSELARKYYTPIITAIKTFNQRYGYAYLTVVTPQGEINVTLRDPMRSIVHITDTRIMIYDIDQNRYEITDVSKLDRKSYKQIELFL